ncbi:Interactor of constitutive active ROPs 4 [Striga hermonthica]|uniref:Interactor of constitutive active ROPs 4 n=1 Tax=Striga hermonthica TaxID=68872 RepID=A0A9N7MWX0_STRHE|nr:Interactor of constitutive active ROPs 4 [Striga hermonthica]
MGQTHNPHPLSLSLSKTPSPDFFSYTPTAASSQPHPLESSHPPSPPPPPPSGSSNVAPRTRTSADHLPPHLSNLFTMFRIHSVDSNWRRMPRLRATDIPQRSSPRGSLRTSSSDSDSLNHHTSPRTDKSLKLSNGPSSKTSQLNTVNKKKLGSRIADLESQLGQAQDELKCLKNKLVPIEPTKKSAQEQLDQKQPKKSPEKTTPPPMDVYEVPVQNVAVELEMEPPGQEKEELKTKPMNLLPKELASEDDDELNKLKAKLDERDKELEILREENENMKTRLLEKSLMITWAESEIGELNLRVSKFEQELEDSKTGAARMAEKLEDAEKSKEELENEMKMVLVQSEQWRKAADEAANILAGESLETGGRRMMVSNRCGSMNKQHYGKASFFWSPGFVDEADEGFGGGKKKGSSGIRMFVGDLWKKKGQK